MYVFCAAAAGRAAGLWPRVAQWLRCPAAALAQGLQVWLETFTWTSGAARDAGLAIGAGAARPGAGVG